MEAFHEMHKCVEGKVRYKGKQEVCDFMWKAETTAERVFELYLAQLSSEESKV